MNKRGQIEMSFGMIFSIIIIIGVIATAFYVISYFLRLGNCTEISLFYQDFQKATDKTWASTISQDVFTGKIPSGIDKVCVGDLNANSSGYSQEREFLKKYRNQNANVFLYPGVKSCNSNLVIYKLNHAKIEGFFCKEVESGKVSFTISKNSNEVLANIK